MKKVCIVTGTRAEFGLLEPVIEKLKFEKDIETQIIATGMHLSPEFGLTYKEIIEAGYSIDAKVEMLLSSDTSIGISKSIGLGVIGFADAFDNLKPDIIILLGDRYESFAAAVAAMCAKIPIAHLHGGELTEGLVDEAIRHSITKMSFLHFTSTEKYRKRVIQLGEAPDRVFCVGALGVENIRNIKLLEKDELESSLKIKDIENSIVVTYHPVTLEHNSAEEQFQNLLNVLSKYTQYHIIFTKANSDSDGRIINRMIDNYTNQHENAYGFVSLGKIRYLSTLKYCKLVVGNSSSGIIEAPSFAIPTVNIGDRQKGRIMGESVISCDISIESIHKAIDKALGEEFRKQLFNCVNPYEGIETSKLIVKTIKDVILNCSFDIKKKFYDIDFNLIRDKEK